MLYLVAGDEKADGAELLMAGWGQCSRLWNVGSS